MRILKHSFFWLFLFYFNVLAQYSDNTPPLGDVQPTGLTHILDIKLTGQTAYLGGTGGLWAIDISNLQFPSELTYTGRSLGTVTGIRIKSNYLYAFTQGNGVRIFDITNPSYLSFVKDYMLSGDDSYEQGLFVENYLYIAAHEKGVQVEDVSVLTSPQHLNIFNTENAFSLAQFNDALLVADGSAGMTVLDITDRENLSLLTSVVTSSSAQDIVVKDHYAFVAVGSAGMDIFDVSTPSLPVLIANFRTDGFTGRLAVENDFAYLANWESTVIVNIADPSSPWLAGTQHASQRAMGIAVKDQTFFVGDWARLRIFEYTGDSAPDINLDPIELAFGSVDAGQVKTLKFTVENLGQEPLAVNSIQVTGSGFSVESFSFNLDPFEERELNVSFQPADQNIATGLVRIYSDDPDESPKKISLSGGNNAVGVGDTPNDFTLSDIEGKSYHLQNYIAQGRIVVLAFFTSW